MDELEQIRAILIGAGWTPPSAEPEPEGDVLQFPGDDASADEVAAFIQEHGYLVESDARNAHKLKPRALPVRYVRAFSRVDLDAMIAAWTDDQMRKHRVTNIGIWNMEPGAEWRDELNSAFYAEWNRRFPPRDVTNNGMGEDGGQA